MQTGLAAEYCALFGLLLYSIVTGYISIVHWWLVTWYVSMVLVSMVLFECVVHMLATCIVGYYTFLMFQVTVL